MGLGYTFKIHLFFSVKRTGNETIPFCSSDYMTLRLTSANTFQINIFG